ncbi:MAG TPA: aminotransferase class I/II-fold pyridoxal phosphate-dependent enzyme [Candidatus Acidoferrales bacterium]|jgi:aspartate/methionine/tyrosine aminotransferase|nr:aminotransferase class I/II-fold pyridoxal phosphate-dependent enzyme [Candidatus Acidoferrales bacterium]
MEFATFLLDEWLGKHRFADPPVEYDLASSTGPAWTLRELMELASAEERERILDANVGYTPAAGTPALREAIAEMQGVQPDEVQVTTGAAEALLVLFSLAAEPGANVVVPSPGFPPFEEVPRALGLEVRRYSLRRENGYCLEPEAIRALTDVRTKLVLVNSPHNPTGATSGDAEMESLDDFLAGRGIQFVVDEVYHPIYYGPTTASAARLPHATVVNDFSKALCLAGLRTGWLVERDRRRMASYREARSYFTVSNTSMGEALAAVAVRQREKILARARQISAANLTRLDGFFAEFSDLFGWVRPRGGMTAFPWLISGENSRAFCEEAARGGVLLAPGDCFGVPAHFRVGFAASGERFPEGLERLADVVRRVAREGRAGHTAVVRA